MNTWTVAPSLLQGAQADLSNWLSFFFPFKQFHKLTWNITFSGLSTMSCCYLKYLNDNFSGFIFCEEKKFIQSELKTTVHPPEFPRGISSFQKRHFKVVGNIKLIKPLRFLFTKKLFCCMSKQISNAHIHTGNSILYYNFIHLLWIVTTLIYCRESIQYIWKSIYFHLFVCMCYTCI